MAENHITPMPVIGTSDAPAADQIEGSKKYFESN